MRLLMLFLILGMRVGYAIDGYAQSTYLTLDLNNKTVKEVFRAIEKNSEYIVFYNDDVVDVHRKVSIQVDNQTVDKILDELFAGTANHYEINDRQIVISRKEALPQQPEMKRIKGKVMDEKGLAMPGATVRIEGTTRGVTTDVDGTFSIDVFPSNRLVISFIGMETQTLLVGSKEEFIIKLQPQVDELEEVAVVAFGRQKKESVIGAISTVTPKDLKAPVSNLTTALAGRIAGLISTQRSGEPGADNAQFFIRGVGSFCSEAKRDPLILIDNIEMSANDLARLQPDDIASFSVMKDATATALYGSRGGNGVILVTTKVGKEGKPKFNVRFETSMSQPTRQIELADPITYMRLHNEAVLSRNPAGELVYSEDKIRHTINKTDPMVYPTNDWQDMMFKDFAVNERLNVSLNGGGKLARYYISGSFNQDNGVLKVNGKNNFNNNINLKNYDLRSNINLQLNPTTELIVRLHGNFEDYNGPLQSGSDYYIKIMNANPVMFPAVYKPDEANMKAKQILFGNVLNGGYNNPYADLVKGYRQYSTSRVLAQLELKQKFDFLTKGLDARIMFNTDRWARFDINREYTPYLYAIEYFDRYTNEYQLKHVNPGSSEALNYNESNKQLTSSVYFEGVVNYNRTFQEKHTVGGLLVYMMRNELTGNAGDLQRSLPHRNMGLSGRFTYGYDSRYYVELNFGLNGSERFAKKHRWGFFPSAGVTWIASNEKFYSENLKRVLSKLKIRGTYGLMGNDRIGDDKDRFYYLSNVNLNDGDNGYSFGTENGYSLNGVKFNRYANDKISWEISHFLNVGLELEFFNKLEINLDGFRDMRTNILMDRGIIPATLGHEAGIRANMGEAIRYGVDGELRYNQSFANGLWLQVQGNFTFARSEYHYWEEAPRPHMPWGAHKGKPFDSYWGFIAERLFIDEADIANSADQKGLSGNRAVLPGDVKYKDMDNNGVINGDDWVNIGFPQTPEVIYGFGFSAGYKGFDLSCFFQGAARTSLMINAEETTPFWNGQRALLKAYADDHWSETNPDPHALWPRLSDTYEGNNCQNSTWFLRDGSFLRLKQMEVGYTLPESVISKLHLSLLRVYLSGSNLLCFSKFKLWDVEMGGNGLGYPVQRVFNAGIQLTF